MRKNSYLVENDYVYFRRARKDDNMEEIALLIYDTDPYIYPYWFQNDENKCISFLKEYMLEDEFIFNYNNLYVAYDDTTDKIVGVVCAIDKTVNLDYDYESLKNINSFYRKTIEEYIQPMSSI